MRAVALWLAVVASACGGGGKPEAPPSGLGQQAADITADTATMKEASGAVNEVIRLAGDCEALKGPAADAKQILDSAERKIRTSTGRTTLESLRKQMQNIVEACP